MRLPMLGIDAAQDTLVGVLCTDATTSTRCQEANTPAGHRRLLTWLKARVALPDLHVCLEVTGGYERAVTEALHAAGATVYCVNPARVKYWALSEQILTKTDAVDARAIAGFAQHARKFHPWQPTPAWQATLQGLVQQRAALIDSITAYQNRQRAPVATPEQRASCATVLKTLRAEVTRLEQATRTLLRTEQPLLFKLATLLIGVGEVTAAVLLSAFGDCQAFTAGRQLGALAGLGVRAQQSGTSVLGRPRITKQGDAAVRKALFWPAITAIRHDPQLKAFADRLAGGDKPKAPLQIICAVMRKLLARFYAVMRTRQPYDPAYRSPLARS